MGTKQESWGSYEVTTYGTGGRRSQGRKVVNARSINGYIHKANMCLKLFTAKQNEAACGVPIIPMLCCCFLNKTASCIQNPVHQVQFQHLDSSIKQLRMSTVYLLTCMMLGASTTARLPTSILLWVECVARRDRRPMVKRSVLRCSMGNSKHSSSVAST